MRAVEDDALRHRADLEDAYYAAGDPIGTYGEYEPATMPIPTTEWYDYE